MAYVSQLPCDGDGVCMLCKTKPPVEETLMCKTCDTPWHTTCLSSPLETSLSNLEWECPDCSSLAGDDDLPVKSAGAVVSHALVAAIRAIESDGTLTELEKARKRQELLSGKAKSEEEEKKKKEADSKGTDVLDVLGDSFNCSFCLQLPERPVTTPCGHNFCLKCFERWIKQGKRTCVKCRSNIPPKMASQPRINSALVVAIRMAKMSKLNITEGPVKVYHFVHNENRPDKAFTTERAQKSGKANAASGKIFVTTPPDHFGPIPAANDPIRNQGVLVGECWEDRLECRQWGVHLPHVSGIAGQSKHGAQSVTLSGGYIDDEDHGEWFLYTGSGGRDLSGNKRTNKDQSFDQKFESYNRSLLVSCMKGYPVRVVRSHKEKRSSYAPEKGLRYDGVYRIEKCWRKVGVQGFRVCRYLFVRCDNEPAPWTSDEHGDRPRPLPAIPELKKATDLSERKEVPSWDFDEEDGCWKWKKPPPPSKKSVARMDDASQKNSRKAARKAQNMSVRERLLKEFSCLICREVMNLPVTTPCAHNFCKLCLEGAFAGKSFVRERSRGGRALRSQKIVMNCPSCPTDISDFLHNPQVNRELTDVIESLKSKAAEEKADEEKASEGNEDLSKESSQEEDEEDDNDDLEEEIKDEESIDISKSNETTEEMSKETGIDDVVKIPETKSKPMKTNKRKKVDAGDCPVENGGDGMKTVGKNSDGSNADSEVSAVPPESTRGANKKAAPAAKRMKKATGGGQGGVGVKTRRGRKAQVTSDGDDSPLSPLLVHSDDNDFE
ncbi:E3 ubiquitin-protein ligase ORTHRUS 2 [Ziziphus jujuba]|uniref:RING-type E3 ubiquitin transferase n=1 Tax=Ziziphus jujuba TaxID=326968 RepID=A0A6P3Z184_ZIZJJ|nr:E3 ubiquitin-protein ligase ORTHRUS 2 [Ziziphus jujuba]